MHLGSDVTQLTRAYLRITGETQVTLASKAGVSQSTVSRAINVIPDRNGAAKARLCIYIQNALADASLISAVDALTEIWDGSEAHANALATLIAASGELWPRLGEG